MSESSTYTIGEIEELTGFDRRTIAYYVQQGLLPRVGRRGPRTRYSEIFVDRLRFIRKIRDLQDRGEMGPMTLVDFRDYFRSTPAETVVKVLEGREPPPENQLLPAEEKRSEFPARDHKRFTAVRSEHKQMGMAPRTEGVQTAPPDRPMSSLSEPTPVAITDRAFPKRSYQSLTDMPPGSAPRDTPSGAFHRLTLDAIEKTPGAPEPPRLSDPAPPIEDELSEALARLNAVTARQPRAYLRTTETWTRARVTEEIILSARGLSERHLPLLEEVARILRRLTREGEV
ncbi:MAG: MerR family transcriptional regulator [Acidobacteriota bacterium]|jgi:DNA-binding transcriptional MerR regulator